MTGKPASKESIEESKMLVLKSLKFIENNWMKDQTADARHFMFGNDLTIADLSLACELAQLKGVNFKFSDYPKVERWLSKVIDNIPEIKQMTKPMLESMGALA